MHGAPQNRLRVEDNFVHHGAVNKRTFDLRK